MEINEEKYILIQQYLDGDLGSTQRLSFESEMASNPGLGSILEEYVESIQVLQREWIRNAWQRINRFAFLRKLGIYGGGLALVAALILSLFWRQGATAAQEISPQEGPSQNIIISQADSTKSDTASSVPGHLTGAQIIYKAEDTNAGRYAIRPAVINETEPAVSSPRYNIQTAVPDQQVVAYKSDKPTFRFDHQLPEQVFTIDQNKDTVLTCANGLKVKIKRNSLMLDNGSAPQGSVQISITELLNYKDLFTAGIGTLSNGNLLETGGSCLITANNAGFNVQLKPGKEMVLYFPNTWHANPTGMCEYVGQMDSAGQINWLLGGNALANGFAQGIKHTSWQTVVNDSVVKDSVVSSTWEIIAPQMNNITRYAFQFDIEYAKGSRRAKIPGEDTLSFFQNYFRALNEMPQKKIALWFQRSDDPLEFEYTVSPDGKLLRVQYTGAATGRLRRDIKVLQRELKHLGQEIGNQYSRDKYLIGENRFFVKIQVQSETRDKILNDADMDGVYFVIRSANFGWINCDRIYAQKRRADFTYPMHDSILTGQLFFMDFRSVIPSVPYQGQVRFHQIPTGANILYIGYGTLNGKPVMQFLKGNTSAPIPVSAIMPFDLEQIRKWLSEIEEGKQNQAGS